MPKLSRAKIANYFADQIVTGEPNIIPRLTAFLLDEGRVRELDLIAADIEQELSTRGIIIADVTSALALDEGFEEAVRQFLAAGKDDKVVIREHVDTSLIGGIKITVGERELDASILNKINRLRAAKGAL